MNYAMSLCATSCGVLQSAAVNFIMLIVIHSYFLGHNLLLMSSCHVLFFMNSKLIRLLQLLSRLPAKKMARGKNLLL